MAYRATLDGDRRPKSNRKVRHPWAVLAVIGTAQLMVVLDVTIVNIALPSAQRDLGFGTDSRQWIITAYSLAFGSLVLLGGRLSDLVGRRRTLLIGLMGFAAASAVGGAATAFAMLVAARAAQGVFAAVLAPAALSKLNVTFADAQQRSKALGVFAAITAGGAVIGLLLGGALTEWLSWRWCLYVNLALALPAAAGVLAFMRARNDRVRDDRVRGVRLDWPGVVTASGGLFCLVYGLSNAQTHGWGAHLTIVMLFACVALLLAFVAIESAGRDPKLALQFLSDRNRVGSYLAIGIAFCGMFGAFLFLTYYLQQNLGYGPMKTGVAFLPLAVGIGVAARRANTRLVPRFGPRPLIPTGMLIAACGMFWLAHLDVDSTYGGTVFGPLIVLGVGVGLTFAPAISAATAGVTPNEAGVALAMVNTSQQIGGAIGTAALSTIFTSALSRYISYYQTPRPRVQAAAAIHGYGVAFGVSSGVFVAGMVITAVLLRSGRLPDVPDVPGAKRPEPAPAPPHDGAANRATELRMQGVNRAGVELILDLELQISQLEAENRYLAQNLGFAAATDFLRPPRRRFRRR
jgi:EmrB/QacA subfamily drug resistance transporter